MDWTLSRLASNELDEIIRYTDRNFGERQTEDYVAGLYDSFALLAQNPEIGRLWAEGRHCYIYRAHYVFYRIIDNAIFITNIRNTRQKIPDGWGKL